MVIIGEIIEQVPVVSTATKSSVVNAIFDEKPELEGILVVEENQPLGLVMKGQFYQKISTKYGFDLFMGRPIELVMDEDILIVDFYDLITTVSSQAMARSQSHLYDYVVVVKNNQLAGIVSIKNLLMKLAEVQVNQAMFTNPLSGLPGNVLIDERILKFLQKPKSPFSLLYLDLDHFKEYNDTYGFTKGDLLLKEVANLLKRHISLQESFIGHVGGDDFVVILPHHDFTFICEELISNFNIKIQSFYNQEDWENQSVYTMDRNGQYAQIPLVSLSIAVLTNEHTTYSSLDELGKIVAKVKKQCKSCHGSCFLSYQPKTPQVST